MLAEHLQLEGFGYNQASEITDHLKDALGGIQPSNDFDRSSATVNADNDSRVVDVPIYDIDPLVRRSLPLQRTRAGRSAAGVN